MAWLGRLPQPILDRLPSFLHPVVLRLLSPTGLALIAGASLLLFVASLIGVPYFLARLPADFFTRRERQERGLPAARRPAYRWLLSAAKNLAGATLVVSGVLMLFLPGQGLLTLLVGMLLLDFPGKRRFLRWVVLRPKLLSAINRLRHGAGRPPLELSSSDPDK